MKSRPNLNDTEVMASASCLCIRHGSTHRRSPVSSPLLDTRRCSTCPTMPRTNREGGHTSRLSLSPFPCSPNFGSCSDDPSPNASSQEKVFLYRNEHIAILVVDIGRYSCRLVNQQGWTRNFDNVALAPYLTNPNIPSTNLPGFITYDDEIATT